MEKLSVQKSVIATVAEVLERDKEAIGLDFDLSKDLGADSLDITQIVMGLEEMFPVALHNLGWASNGKVTAEQMAEDICRLMGAPAVQAAT